jgi:hypothetical protein
MYSLASTPFRQGIKINVVSKLQMPPNDLFDNPSFIG